MGQDHRPSSKELRQFGLLVGAVFMALGLWPLVVGGESIRIWPSTAGLVLIAAGLLIPTVLAPVHKGWMMVGHVLGWINTRILLCIVFYGLVMPIGFLLRLMGKNTIRQGFEKDSQSYRVVRVARPHTHMKHQF